ncbi:MAG: ATP-binding cassette domain-containing protein, partial [Flavobacteriales bacterium]
MIEVNDLSFSYGGNAAIVFPDFKCNRGEKLLLLGDSGTGKTTLLHLLCGLLRPKSGSMNVAGVDINSLNDRQLDKFRGRELGIVFQQSHFVQSLTVAENLSLPALMSGTEMSATELQKRTLELLERLGVGHKSDAKP